MIGLHANKVDFVEFNDACSELSKKLPAFPSIEHPVKPKRISTPLTNYAIPTNSFGLNLIVDNGDMPIYAHPYSLRAPSQVPYGIITSLTQMRIFGDPVPDRKDSARYYLTPFTSALGVCSLENAAVEDAQDRFIITQTEKSSVHMLFPSPKGVGKAKTISTDKKWDDLEDLIKAIPQGSMLLPIVRGMSFITSILNDSTPAVFSSSVFLKANGKEIKDGSTVMGERIQLFLNNDETWVIYALDGPIRFKHIRDWKVNSNAEKYTSALVADAPYTGAIRIVKLFHRGDWSDFGPSVNHIQRPISKATVKRSITDKEMNDPDFITVSEANTLFNRHVNTIPLGMNVKWYRTIQKGESVPKQQKVSIRHHHRDAYVLPSNYPFEHYELGMYGLLWQVIVHRRAFRPDVLLHRQKDQLSTYDNQLLHYAFPHQLDSLGLPTADEHDEYNFLIGKMNVTDIYTGEHYDPKALLTSTTSKMYNNIDVSTLSVNDQLALRYSIDDYSAIPTSITAYSTTKGTMRAIIGNTWYLPEWIPKNEIISSLPLTHPRQSAIVAITEALSHDIQSASERAINAAKNDGVYTSGKELYRLGQLCLVGKYLKDHHKVDYDYMECAEALKTGLDLFRFGKNGNPLKRDTVWGGLIGSQGLPEEHRLADFGNTMYNDHHFHFGYVIASAAICAELLPSWVGKEGLLNKVFQNDNIVWVDSLIMDVSNPCPDKKDQKHTPFFRNFDPFVGHTWSQGLFASWDGKDLESTSESLLYDYGVARWGYVTDRPGINYFGRLLTAIEIRSFRKYFQMQAYDDIEKSRVQMISDSNAMEDEKMAGGRSKPKPSVYYFHPQTDSFMAKVLHSVFPALYQESPSKDPSTSRGLPYPTETSLIPVSQVSVHPTKFARNMSPGISFEGKVDHATWFGLNPEYIHGIQMLPQTPVLSLVRPADFVQAEWDNIVKKTAQSINTGWKGILYLDYATIDPRDSYEVLGNYLNYQNEIDNGMSRTWSLFWAAAKPPPNFYRNIDRQIKPYITDDDKFPDVRLNKGFSPDGPAPIQLKSLETPTTVFSLDSYIETCARDLTHLGLLNSSYSDILAHWDVVKYHLKTSNGSSAEYTHGSTNRYSLFDHTSVSSSWNSLPTYIRAIIITACSLVAALCICLSIVAFIMYRRHREAQGKAKPAASVEPAHIDPDFREPTPHSPVRQPRDPYRQSERKSPLQSPFTRATLPDLPRATVSGNEEFPVSPRSPIDDENPSSPNSDIFSPKFGKPTTRRFFND